MKAKIKKWIEISRELYFQKYSRKIEKVIFRLPNDKEVDFYLKREGPTCCVVALTKENKVVMVRGYRPGPDRVLLELPGGYLEKGEAPSKAIFRELLEETGYRGDIRLIGACFDDAYSTMKRYCFVATDCIKITEPELDKNEFSEVELVSLPNFLKLLRKGQMTDVEVGYLALDYLNLLKFNNPKKTKRKNKKTSINKNFFPKRGF